MQSRIIEIERNRIGFLEREESDSCKLSMSLTDHLRNALTKKSGRFGGVGVGLVAAGVGLSSRGTSPHICFSNALAVAYAACMRRQAEPRVGNLTSLRKTSVW
jgi:hypothetical protein